MRRLVAVAAAFAVMAGCSGSQDGGQGGSDTIPAASGAADAGSTSAVPSTQGAASTTLPATTAAATTTEAVTTTTDPFAGTSPLTGLAPLDPASLARPALVVKIDNAPAARPQTGFNSADIVVEEIVNDNITRFAMVFQSTSSNPVGPIRSGRLQDIDLFSAFNRPLFAWSGGNRTVTEAIQASDLVDIGPNTRGSLYYRARGRSAPHNLYANTDDLWSMSVFAGGPPQPQFRFRPPGQAPAGQLSTGVAIKLDSIDVRWDFDPETNRYRREMEGRVHADAATGDQITTDNVLVLVVEYAEGISGSPDAQTTGTGEVFLFTAGTVVHGTWTRSDVRGPFTLTADDGSPILLTPGRTFIELPEVAATLPLLTA